MNPSELLKQAVPAAQVAELKAAMKLLREMKSVPIDTSSFFTSRSFTLPH